MMLAFVGASAPLAQSVPTSGEITHVEGSVEVDGQSSPRLNSVLPENSLVRTAKGRGEIRFGRGDTLFLGEYSSIRVRRNANIGSDEPEILTGVVVVIIGGLGPVVSCVQEVQLSDAGVFRFDVHQVTGETFCRLKVYKGAAPTQMPGFVWVLTSGKTINLNRSCGDHTPRDEFNIEDIDGLDSWSRQRRSAEHRF
jgi:hypothetical protein